MSTILEFPYSNAERVWRWWQNTTVASQLPSGIPRCTRFVCWLFVLDDCSCYEETTDALETDELVSRAFLCNVSRKFSNCIDSVHPSSTIRAPVLHVQSQNILCRSFLSLKLLRKSSVKSNRRWKHGSVQDSHPYTALYALSQVFKFWCGLILICLW